MQVAVEPEVRQGETLLNLQPLTSDSIKELVQLFKLLADETRMRILYFLHQADELNVLELCTLLDQRQPSVSHHLALLRVAGLIDMRRDGKHNYYRIERPKFEEFARRAFEVAPSGPFRMLFDNQELRYGPVADE